MVSRINENWFHEGRILKGQAVISPKITFSILNSQTHSEAVAQMCSVKKMFLEISKIHRKTPVPESLF